MDHKVRAIEEYSPNGWRGQILVIAENRPPEWEYVTACPLFSNPHDAIRWTMEWLNKEER